MKKFKSYKVLCLTLGLGIALSGTALNAASVTKTLKATYNNILVSFNGQTKSLSSEPFIVNGVTYVPLRAVGEIMGASVNWANNTVYITSQNTTSVSTEQEIASKNFQIASLQQQLDAAKKELETYKGTGTAGSNLTTAAINNTLNRITSDFGDEYSIDWDFDLRQSSGRLQLTVSYNSKNDGSRFNKLTESKRKQFIKEICYDISNLHKDVEIRGTLEDSRSNTEIANFRYTKTNSFTYDEKSSISLSDLSTDLERYYKSITLGGSVTLPIKSIALSERVTNSTSTLTATLNVTLLSSNSDYRADWNSISRSSLRNYLKDIVDDIEDEYDNYDSIVVIVKDSYYGNIADYEDGIISINTVSTAQ